MDRDNRSEKTKLKLLNRQNKKATKNFGSPWSIVATTLIIFIVSQVVAAFIVGLALSIAHSAGSSSEPLTSSAPAQFFFVLLAEVGAVWLVFRVLKSRGLKLPSIGLGRRPQQKDLTKALIGFSVFFVLIIFVNALLSFVFPELNSDQKQEIGFDKLSTSLDYVLAFISLVILAPIGEEILVRGYLYSGLRTRWKVIPAMIITSLVFGLAHLQLGSGTAILWAAGVNTFVLSIVLVYMRERTGALYAGILIHSMNNVIAFSVYFNS